jgi:hypothetical protein
VTKIVNEQWQNTTELSKCRGEITRQGLLQHPLSINASTQRDEKRRSDGGVIFSRRPMSFSQVKEEEEETRLKLAPLINWFGFVLTARLIAQN